MVPLNTSCVLQVVGDFHTSCLPPITFQVVSVINMSQANNPTWLGISNKYMNSTFPRFPRTLNWRHMLERSSALCEGLCDCAGEHHSARPTYHGITLFIWIHRWREDLLPSTDANTQVDYPLAIKIWAKGFLLVIWKNNIKQKAEQRWQRHKLNILPNWCL